MTDISDSGALQAVLLTSILSGRPVPGMHSPLRPADLPLATDPDGTVRILRAGLEPEAAALVAASGTAARLVEESQLSDAQSDQGVQAIVRLRGPETLDGEGVGSGSGPQRVLLAIDVCGVREGALLPLGSTMVTFRREGGAWIAEGLPTELAT